MTALTLLPAIVTPRLSLREMMPSDVEGFASFMLQPDYQRYIAQRFQTKAEVGAFVGRCIARQRHPPRDSFHLAAEEHDTGEVIGDGFLLPRAGSSVELGWGLHPAMWSMGLGTEIGEALLSIAFEHLEASQCWSKIMRGNSASQGLARRIGMRRQKLAVGVSEEGHAIDIYAITAPQYFDRAY